MTSEIKTPATTRRLVRSFLRYLKERVGDAAYDAIARELPPPSAALMQGGGAGADAIPLDDWLTVLRTFEARFGDPSTLQLLRETTRATMAVAVDKGWSTFLADVTPDLLLARSGTFWSMSYDTGRLVVRARGPRRCLLALEGWDDPPPEVVAMLAEACVVFLVRLGERGGRAIERRDGATAEIEAVW
jgi:hypothetical protein